MTAWRPVGSAKAERETGNHQPQTAKPDTLEHEDEHEHDALPLTTLRVLVESATNGSD